MKTKLFLLLLLLTASVSAQAPAALQSEVKKLYTACHDIDITALTEMLCTTEADIYGTLDSYFLNDNDKFRYVFTNVKYNYSAPQTIDGKTYYLINFRNMVRVTYFKPVDVAAKQAELKALFGATEITYNKDRNAFLLAYPAKMLAIQDNGWKFAFLDKTLPPVSAGCITENVKKAFGLQ